MGSFFSKDTSISKQIKRIWNEENYSPIPDGKSVGSKFNSWRAPVLEFGPLEDDLAVYLQEQVHIGHYEPSEESWQKCCKVVDVISQSFHVHLKKTALEFYPGLVLKDFIKQGSSREGLKIRNPEFDMILPFAIEGVNIRPVPTKDSDNNSIPALFKLKVLNPQVKHGSRYQLLRESGVFEKHGSEMFLNAINVKNRVMSSIMDITFSRIQEEMDKEVERDPYLFTLSKTITQSSVYRFKIKIKYGEDRRESVEIRIENATPNVIEFNVIPGFLLQPDSVPDPNSWFSMLGFNSSMECDKYAVMDWVQKGRHSVPYPTPQLLWTESTCGYEKYIIDVSRRTKSNLYILTACRIMKAYIDIFDQSSQLRIILPSYLMKNIAIHCILLRLEVSGVREALGCLMIFLEICLEKEFLSHFVYGNAHLSTMLSKSQTSDEQKRLNLFNNIPRTHFQEAKCSLRVMKGYLRGSFTESSHLNRQILQYFEELCSQSTGSENTSYSCALM
ncbi:uncharacterized protein LOC117336625 [Pecten maximus]|uniref:uncharacterized protein LOC117336625 n=1 Tax=Pecten maximus TaxID=6579 RepID=UPI001457FD53|nr:uncharacterized protein LOC117336625 [Pecten maximus]